MLAIDKKKNNEKKRWIKTTHSISTIVRVLLGPMGPSSLSSSSKRPFRFSWSHWCVCVCMCESRDHSNDDAEKKCLKKKKTKIHCGIVWDIYWWFNEQTKPMKKEFINLNIIPPSRWMKCSKTPFYHTKNYILLLF